MRTLHTATAVCAALEWNLVFREPRLLGVARGGAGIPSWAGDLPPPGILRGSEARASARIRRRGIPGLPFGNCLPISDGPLNNSTGTPFFYVTPKDPVVADLMKNPMASLLLPESEGEFCRKNIVDPEDPRCARLTLTGQMIAVSPEEVEFAKQAMFSRSTPSPPCSSLRSSSSQPFPDKTADLPEPLRKLCSFQTWRVSLQPRQRVAAPPGGYPWELHLSPNPESRKKMLQFSTWKTHSLASSQTELQGPRTK
nr:PREDICTED: protein CREG2 [Equus przewalskii]